MPLAIDVEGLSSGPRKSLALRGVVLVIWISCIQVGPRRLSRFREEVHMISPLHVIRGQHIKAPPQHGPSEGGMRSTPPLTEAGHPKPSHRTSVPVPQITFKATKMPATLLGAINLLCSSHAFRDVAPTFTACQVSGVRNARFSFDLLCNSMQLPAPVGDA